MALGDADRQRKSRAHRAADHRLCDPRTCDAVKGDVGSEPLGSTAVEMELWADALAIPVGDVRRPLVECALVLADMVDRRQGMPGSARELAQIVGYISEFQDQASRVDEIRAQRAQRRVTMLVKNIGNGAS